MSTRKDKDNDDGRSASEMANRGAEKELKGYSSAFAFRDKLKAEEQAAERQRAESREQRKATRT